MGSNIVGRRVLKISLAASLCFVFISAAFLFAIEYRSRIRQVESEIRNLRDAQVAGMAEGLWNYDKKILQALVSGFDFHPYISYVVVEDQTGIIVSSGSKQDKNRFQSVPLVRKKLNGETTQIGQLGIEINSEGILADVLAQVGLSIVFQMLSLLSVSIALMLLYSRLVTRHLAAIAAYIRNFEVQPSLPNLTLAKKYRGDEFDVLVQSFNAMRENLTTARNAELHAMEQLRISEEVNRVLVDEAPDAIMMFDADAGHFISGNRRAESLFGRSLDDLFQSSIEERYAPTQPDGLSARESVDAAIARALAGETVITQRAVMRPNGETITCEVRLTAIPAVGKRVLRVSYLDITERVKAEEAVSRSLREKEVLLQEVYHRTKNNMQLIAAFLNMEAMESGDQRIGEILNEMIGRITSMALVHQKLYEAKDLSRIDLGEYLEDLVTEVRKAYLARRPEVSIIVEADRGIISVLDIAIPCGLALNELIVNSLKYAFPQGRPGSIRVILSKEEDQTLKLAVSDDGIGVPEHFDFRKNGKIGLQTVISLIELQLRGTLSFHSDSTGTTCTASVDNAVYGARV